MPACAIPIGISNRKRERHACWSLLELVLPGGSVTPFGILFVDTGTDELSLRCRSTAEMEVLCSLCEQETDLLDFVEADLRQRAREQGGAALLAYLEDTLSNFLRVTDRTEIAYTGSPQGATDRLFDTLVDSTIRPFETHLPLYSLRAAATKFGEGMATGEAAGDEDRWVRVRPGGPPPRPGMFIARVVGRSMEPLIPDGSFCIFRAGVTGSRQGKYLLIEKFGESDFAGRYTVKRYTSEKKQRTADLDEEGAWEHTRIRLEPLNREFEAFDLGPGQFRVIAEFVEVAGPASDLD
jgi:hypothetical protein